MVKITTKKTEDWETHFESITCKRLKLICEGVLNGRVPVGVAVVLEKTRGERCACSTRTAGAIPHKC